uniref:DUF4158 domain-containing protein n=1 Tax=Caballeronia sordidicola TaxID=196367 RepID=UPI002119C212|nr:DUF4158 domain-containing protein [Caballeronia sordidicola]
MERYFALTDSDIAAINERCRRDRLAGVAIQLVFLRASGGTLDHVGALPRQLLRHIGERLGLPTRLSRPFAHFIGAIRRCTSIRSGSANISA